MNTLRLKRIIHGVAVLLIIVGASILIHPGVSSSAPDVVYVYIEGIRGPSQDANHVGWIEASSFSMVLTGASTHPATKPVFGPLRVVKPYDMASPKIALTAALG